MINQSSSKFDRQILLRNKLVEILYIANQLKLKKEKKLNEFHVNGLNQG